MLERLKSELKTAPEHITRRRQALSQRVHQIRWESEERLWTLGADALTRAEDLLERAERLPVVSRVATPVERLVARRLTAHTAPPVAGYDDLNARNAALSVRGRSRVDLLKIRRYEAANKNRKTVLDAVNREMERLPGAPAEVAVG